MRTFPSVSVLPPMSNTVPRFSPGDPRPDPEVTRFKVGLVKLLPWLHTRARRQLPPQVLRRLSTTPEDLVQLATVSALGRIEAAVRTHGVMPDWGRDEGLLRGYLGGAIWRMAMRLLRDHGAGRTEPIEPEQETASQVPPIEAAEELDRAKACLSVLTPDELRLAAGFGMGKSYAELSRRLGASPATLAKRRERILRRLRAQCLECRLRVVEGCSWVPADWV